MKFIGRLLIVAVVIGGACAWVMYNGQWGAITSFTAAVFGQDAADGVDEFGHLSKDVSDDVVDYGSQLSDQIKNGETVTPDWGSIGDALGSFTSTTSERQPDYSRDEFGDGWLDLDGDGCRTRDEILARDLTDKTVDGNGCTVLAGKLADPYTGKSIAFKRGAATSTAVQIDHIVPLALGWREGAWKWSEEKRQAFANDPMNLLAVDGPSNSSKSDKSISDWLPSSGKYHCTYVALYVAVHDKYDLAMSIDDKAKAAELIAACD